MNRRHVIITLLVIVVLIAGGYFAYTYVKEKPPSWLIGLASRTEPPPPLPAGDAAPFTVPEGFTATIFARDISGARVMVRDQKGTLLVSQTKGGSIVALPDLDGDQKADQTITVLEGLNQPHGLYVYCPDTGSVSADQDSCELYVAETDSVKAYRYDADTYTASNPRAVASLPSGGGHFTRTFLPHPDGKQLLVSVGSSCNVCVESDQRRATVQALDLATGALTTFAGGLRNTVFMAIHPVTGAIWGTDNGRDLIGNDIPPDEINIIAEGNDYGWPLCYGNNIYDTDFGRGSAGDCVTKTPPQVELPAHAAALGIGFVPEEGWPEDWWHDAIVALHGSWNRSEPAGYKVVRVDLAPDGTPVGTTHDVMTGFLPEGSKETDDAIGRPAGILMEPGGIMYVSDDHAGAIYRISLTTPPR